MENHPGKTPPEGKLRPYLDSDSENQGDHESAWQENECGKPSGALQSFFLIGAVLLGCYLGIFFLLLLDDLVLGHLLRRIIPRELYGNVHELVQFLYWPLIAMAKSFFRLP